MTETHKRIGGRELKTVCGKRYTVFDTTVMFYWKDVTCKKCQRLRKSVSSNDNRRK